MTVSKRIDHGNTYWVLDYYEGKKRRRLSFNTEADAVRAMCKKEAELSALGREIYNNSGMKKKSATKKRSENDKGISTSLYFDEVLLDAMKDRAASLGLPVSRYVSQLVRADVKRGGPMQIEPD